MAKSTPKTDSNMRVPMQTVVVQRDGKMMSPPIGTPFQFSKDEIEQIDRMNPDALSTKGTIDVTEAKGDAGGEEV